MLFGMLFDDDDAEKLKKLIGGGRPRPVIQIRSGDPLLCLLPWELLHLEGRFLLREGDVDLVRTTTDDVDGATLLKAPSEPFKLVVNVSAPEDSKLDYERGELSDLTRHDQKSRRGMRCAPRGSVWPSRSMLGTGGIAPCVRAGLRKRLPISSSSMRSTHIPLLGRKSSFITAGRNGRSQSRSSLASAS